MHYLVVLTCLLILPAQVPANVVTFPGAVAEGYSAVAEVNGDLQLPNGKAGGQIPVVLILHGSGGIDGRGDFHGKALKEAGIGTLEIFMFSRGNRPGGGSRENFTHMYGALKYLASRSEIDPRRIGVMGFSWGGGLSCCSVGEYYSAVHGWADPLRRSRTILSCVLVPTKGDV